MATKETSGPRRGLVEEEIYRHALQLFDEKGYASTSLKDIADSMGTSRSSLYYYFDTKDEILERLVEEITQGGSSIIAGIESSGAPADERLAAAVESMVHRRLEEPERFRVLDRCEGELPEPLSARHLEAKRRVLASISSIIDDGMRAGQFRPADSKVAAFAIIGMCNWVAWWYRPSSSFDPQAISTQLTRMALASVRGADTPEEAPHSPAAMIAGIRSTLDQLEHVVRPLT